MINTTGHNIAPKPKADENTSIFVICDICDGPVTETGSRSQLEQSGWEITRNCVFCPLH